MASMPGVMGSGAPYAFLSGVPDQLGYQVLNSEGAVIVSAGELENRDQTAAVVHRLVNVPNSLQLTNNEPIKKIQGQPYVTVPNSQGSPIKGGGEHLVFDFFQIWYLGRGYVETPTQKFSGPGCDPPLGRSIFMKM